MEGGFWPWYEQARDRAIAHQVPLGELDWLLVEWAGVNRLKLRLHDPDITLGVELALLDGLWQRRLRDRVPVQYLAGMVGWRNFRLQVSPSVLIPRPETELIIDVVAELTAGHQRLKHGQWADLGTGSGAIALSLAENMPEATIWAIDRSPEALVIAQANAQLTGLGDRIRFAQGNWFEPLAAIAGHLAGMVSNPPYIPSQTVLGLDPEVMLHEPHLALDGGPDGLDCLRHLAMTAPRYLMPGGLWVVELMAGQAPAVVALLKDHGCYQSIATYPDLSGIDRFVSAYYQPLARPNFELEP
ncbi:MAG: peptide chain release factor N(5)-glutamine methyltransferase [Oscillatoriales cyanobacterium]|nr:MAG: peptide chain release factor N(5)-glutamine methyltransferase [Oscillatoriales cyanobacterium]